MAVPRSASRAAARSAGESVRRFAAGDTRCLALLWDVDGLTAAVVDGAESAPVIVVQARSGAPRFASALASVLAELRSHTAVPRRTVVAARNAVAAVLDLPVDPARPRASREMAELVRGEIEASLAQLNSTWTIGAILAARGHLEPAARTAVVDAMAAARVRRGATLLRFGETAERLGLATRVQVEEALAIQQRLHAQDVAPACAWIGFAAGDKPVWLAAAVAQDARAEWRAALAEERLQLAAIASPTWLASQPFAAESGRSTAIELHIEEVAIVVREGARVVESNTEPRLERAIDATWLAGLLARTSPMPAAIELVNLDAALDPALGGLADAVAAAAHAEVRVRSASAASRERMLVGLAAATAPAPRIELTFKATAKRARALPCISANEPRGPLWKHPQFPRIAAAAAILLVLLGYAAQQGIALARARADLAARDAAERQQSSVSAREASVRASQQQARRDLQQARDRLAGLHNETERLQRIANLRHDLPALLDALSRAVGDDVLLDAIHHSKVDADVARIEVVGWSPGYAAAQAFASRAQLEVAPLGFAVTQSEIVAADGRYEEPGNRISFWLVPASNEELEAQPESLSSTAMPATVARVVKPAARAANPVRHRRGAPAGGAK